jgi:tRNA U34 2-thiouridine synthase MnmA/TrmU
VVVLPEALALQRDVLLAEAVWRLGDGPTRVEACVRYRAAPVSAVATLVPQGLHLDFAEPVGVLAPGQSVVCYRGARVVGGGVVTGTRVESPGQESYARSATGPV